jgi:hypothetical protein
MPRQLSDSIVGSRPLPAGWYAITVNELRGYPRDHDWYGGTTQLRDRRPIARAGYSILIFVVHD